MKCARYTTINTEIKGNKVWYDGNKLVCDCYKFLRDGNCHHAREAIAKSCNWRGEPNMTIENGRPKKVCPRCGYGVC